MDSIVIRLLFWPDGLVRAGVSFFSGAGDREILYAWPS